MDIEKKDIISATRGLLYIFPATIQDTKTTKNGFRYSDGWIVTHVREYHLTAPLPKSVPKIGRSARAKTTKKKPIIPNLRILDKLVADKQIIRENDIIAYIACL